MLFHFGDARVQRGFGGGAFAWAVRKGLTFCLFESLLFFSGIVTLLEVSLKC